MDSKQRGAAARTRRIVMSAVASLALLGAGAAIGVTLTGGASAATGGSQNVSATSAASAAAAASAATASPMARCDQLARVLRRSGHPKAGRRVGALCNNALLRLALVGGIHGEVTFEAKSGPKTLAFERGTIESVTSAAIVVTAADGTTWTWDLLPSTVIRSAGHQVTAKRLADGEQVIVAGPVTSGVNDARLIRIRKASG
jgi:hypothetical protein